MKFDTPACDKPRRRFVGWVISLMVFFVASAFSACAVAGADAPLRYVNGAAFLTSVLLFTLNAAVQLPFVFSDRGLGSALETVSPRAVPLAGALTALFGVLPLAGGCLVSAYRAAAVLRTANVSEIVRSYRGMSVTAVLTLLFFLAGAVGLLLSAVAPRRYPAAEVILHLPLPLGCTTFAMYLYFDKSTPRNATLKLSVSLALLLLALLLLLRIRMLLGTPRPRLTVWLGRASLPYTAGVGISLLCMYLHGKQIFITPVLPFALLFLSFYLFVTVIRPTVGIKPLGSPAGAGDATGQQDPDDGSIKED